MTAPKQPLLTSNHRFSDFGDYAANRDSLIQRANEADQFPDAADTTAAFSQAAGLFAIACAITHLTDFVRDKDEE